MWGPIRTADDVHRLLRRFRTVIYTGDALGEIELMRDELRELYEARLIDKETLAQALHALKEREDALRAGGC